MRLTCLAAVALAGGCARLVGGVPLMPPAQGPYLDGMDVDELLLTTSELRDLTGAGPDLNGVPGMDSAQAVDDDLLADSAPPECQFVFRESTVFGPDVKQFHETSFQTPPKQALLSEAAAAYLDTDTALRTFDNVADLVKTCGSTDSGYAYVYDWTADSQTVRAESFGDCGRTYRLQSTVLIEVTYCGYHSHVIADLVATRIAAKVGVK
ncbi:MAG: sensor domain-containing protein [Mycobacteriaceae bacterium]|nr:sensor domain-containing protein [Mycobacteriaceae bacterium]